MRPCHILFFIHGSNEVKNLGNPVSHGCVRISPENAATLYALVAKNGLQNTQVVLTGATAGGEFKVASPAGVGFRSSQADFGWYQSGDNYYTQLQTRPGFSERLFGSPCSQGYYGQPRVFYQPRGY
jgi:hypothetical protein